LWQLATGLAGLALLTYLLLNGHAKLNGESATQSSVVSASDFDYFMSGMDRTTFTADSAQMHHLQALDVRHFPDDDRADLSQPRFTWIETTDTSWQVQADSGQLFRRAVLKTDLLQLHDQVKLSKPLPDGEIITVETEQLEVDIATKSFSTAAPVRLSSATMLVTSRGMSGQLDSYRLELLHEVSGRHE